MRFVSWIMLSSNTMSIFIIVQDMPQHPILLIRCKHLKLCLRDKITLLVKWAWRDLWWPILLIIKRHKLIFIELSNGRRFKVGARRHNKGSWLANLEMYLLCFLKFPLIFSHRCGLISFNHSIMHGLCRWLRPKVSCIICLHCYLFRGTFHCFDNVSYNLLAYNNPKRTVFLVYYISRIHHTLVLFP
jgi:hypothetical protein